VDQWDGEDPKEYKIRQAKERAKLLRLVHKLAADRNVAFDDIATQSTYIFKDDEDITIYDAEEDNYFHDDALTMDVDTIEELRLMLQNFRATKGKDHAGVDMQGMRFPPMDVTQWPRLHGFLTLYEAYMTDRWEPRSSQVVEYDERNTENRGCWIKSGKILPQGTMHPYHGRIYYGDHPDVIAAKDNGNDTAQLNADVVIVGDRKGFLLQCNDAVQRFPDTRPNHRQMNSIRWCLFAHNQNLGFARSLVTIGGTH
jgi:hypothetical protein